MAIIICVSYGEPNVLKKLVDFLQIFTAHGLFSVCYHRHSWDNDTAKLNR